MPASFINCRNTIEAQSNPLNLKIIKKNKITHFREFDSSRRKLRNGILYAQNGHM